MKLTDEQKTKIIDDIEWLLDPLQIDHVEIINDEATDAYDTETGTVFDAVLHFGDVTFTIPCLYNGEDIFTFFDRDCEHPEPMAPSTLAELLLCMALSRIEELSC